MVISKINVTVTPFLRFIHDFVSLCVVVLKVIVKSPSFDFFQKILHQLCQSANLRLESVNVLGNVVRICEPLVESLRVADPARWRVTSVEIHACVAYT